MKSISDYGHSLDPAKIISWKNKLVEVTGVSAVGKSSFLNDLNNSSVILVFDAGMIVTSEAGEDKSVYYCISEFVQLILFLYVNKNITPRDIKWLFLSSMKIKASYLMRFNVFRNCLLKFFHYHMANSLTKKYPSSVVFVDEGISHIPFLLQDQVAATQMRAEFFDRFKDWLSPLNVLCLDSDIDTFHRLQKRGHKRLKGASDEKITRFVKLNLETLECIKQNSSCFSDFVILRV